MAAEPAIALPEEEQQPPRLAVPFTEEKKRLGELGITEEDVARNPVLRRHLRRRPGFHADHA